MAIDMTKHVDGSALKAFGSKILTYEKGITDAIDSKVNTLVGSDSNKSVRTIANEELAAQLLSGKADADFKTLKALSDWLEGHPEEVAQINSDISALQAIVTGIGGESDDYATITAYVEAKVAALGIGNYYTKTEADGKFVAIEENKSLMTADEHTKLAGIQAEATKTSIAAETFTAGTKVAELNINGNVTEVKVPTVSFSATKTSGVKVGSASVNGVTTDFYVDEVKYITATEAEAIFDELITPATGE